MLDDSDIDFTILAWPTGGWIIGLLGFIVVVVMVLIVTGNEKECATKHCERGTAVLMHHECLCVEKPEE